MLRLAKKYWRELVIVIMIVVFGFTTRRCSQIKDNEDIAVHARDSAYTVIKIHQLINGQRASQVQNHEVTIGQLKNDLGLNKDSIAHLKAQIGSLNNLVGYWKGVASVRGSFTTTLHDTIYIDKHGVAEKGGGFEWNNKFLFEKGFIPNDGKDITIEYRYNPTWTLVTYRKPRPFSDYLKFKFGSTPLVADIKFDDPNVVTSKFSGVVIKEEPKKWYQTTGAKIGFGAIGGIIAWKQLH